LPWSIKPRHPRRPAGALRLCISYWLLFRQAGRPSTATLGLGGDSHSARFPHHPTASVLRPGLWQEMALLRGQTVRSGFAFGTAAGAAAVTVGGAENRSGVVSVGRRAAVSTLLPGFTRCQPAGLITTSSWLQTRCSLPRREHLAFERSAHERTSGAFRCRCASAHHCICPGSPPAD
jgi:hypothetical protein